MKWVMGVIAVLAAAWLQVSLFGHVRPLGVIPDLTLVVIVMFGLWVNATPALTAAIGGGLLLDLASGSDFGLRTAYFVVIVLALIAWRQLGLHGESLFTVLVAVAVAVILYNGVILFTLRAGLSAEAVSRIGRDLADCLAIAMILYLGRAVVVRRRRPTLEFGDQLS